MWWGTPQHISKARNEEKAAESEAEKMAGKVPLLGSKPMDIDVGASGQREAVFSQGLQSLLAAREGCDLVFSVCDKEFPCHAVVLAAASQNFRQYLRKNPLPGALAPVSLFGLSMQEDSEEDPMKGLLTKVAVPEAASTPAPEAGNAQEAPAAEASESASSKSAEAGPLKLQVGIETPESLEILLGYLYVASTGAKWEYTPRGGNQVNKDVLRLARSFGLGQLHEYAARWLAKGLTTANVVDRLVSCEEFGLGLLRERIVERLAQNPSELMIVSGSPEIMKHPRILQDLLIQIASLRDKAPKAPAQQPEKRERESETEASAAEDAQEEVPETKAEEEVPETKAEKPSKAQRGGKASKVAEKPQSKRARKAGGA
eukprot:TRINITY_DN112113_c0_g1_i1.p1 TRINITY_DN112113_c0_g1~~TRINITY_DN112113_c0_g1_i1.p1  ORF type:complete len:373 (-),score=126.03 TRINITY_DN112113_c0_g1_i1:438-1556(-)